MLWAASWMFLSFFWFFFSFLWILLQNTISIHQNIYLETNCFFLSVYLSVHQLVTLCHFFPLVTAWGLIHHNSCWGMKNKSVYFLGNLILPIIQIILFVFLGWCFFSLCMWCRLFRLKQIFRWKFYCLLFPASSPLPLLTSYFAEISFFSVNIPLHCYCTVKNKYFPSSVTWACQLGKFLQYSIKIP